MEQIRMDLPGRDASNPVSRLVFALIAIPIVLAIAAAVIFVVLPVLGIIVSAAVGGIILALAGILMMVPFMLLAGTVLALVARSHARKPGTIRARPYWR
jgi:positive regulator of sigma E activity